MTGKELIIKFYNEVFNKWDLSNIDEYMRDDYIQHNPTVEDGKAGFVKFTERFFATKPYAEIQKITEDGDLVWVFFKCSQTEAGTACKVVDIYRIEDGKLAEHWDVVQGGVENDNTANGHGHF